MPKGENNRKLTNSDRREIVRLYTTPLPDGTWMGVTSIARQFEVANACVQYHLKRAGVQTRSPAEAHSGGKRCKPIKNLPTGKPPPCKCGCELPTTWNRRKNRWNRYLIGHYTQKGQQNPAWLHGCAYEPYTSDWKEVSRTMRARDSYTCQRCNVKHGKRSPALHVHHIDCDKTNNDPANLVTLCRHCHGATHAEAFRLRMGG